MQYMKQLDLQKLTKQLEATKYNHYARDFIQTSVYEAQNRKDFVETSTTFAFDYKDKAWLDDEYYSIIMFVHPPRNSVSISDGISSDMWRAQKDMSDEMLTKVKRNNKIMVEFSGSANIVRAD